VRNVAVDPPQTTFRGGGVTITAEATDEDGDTLMVQATVTPPSGTTQTITLTKGDGSPYRGTYTAPGNPTTRAQTHEIRVTASDGKASDTEPPTGNDPIWLTVNPAEAPPDVVQF
jgi:hypothetical protein